MTPQRASYERFALGDKHAILMNSPRRPDGPPVRNGKPYSAIAHLAESVIPFVAMANGLRERGFSAPDILNADLDRGLLFIEDLGDERVVAGDPPAPIPERYERALDVLLALHAQKLPQTLLVVSPHVEYRIPAYDMEAFLIEAELLLDWFLPRFGVAIQPARPRGVPHALERAAAAGDRIRRRPGCCATSIRPTCCGCRCAAGSPSSAFWIFRMR